MAEQDSPADHDTTAAHLYDVRSGDPSGEMVDRSALSPADLDQINRLMRALVDLRAEEQAILDASEKYMKLSAQDMRALHYLIVAKNRGDVITPTLLAAHLNISPASTTKLLNRLERGGHIIRRLHPTDRRAFSIDVAPETEASAKQTVGRQHAKRLNAAARLTPDEREIVIRFLRDMANEISISTADWARAAQ